MLTKKQEEWISHLSTNFKIEIIPFDKSAEEKFQKVKSIIREKLGKDKEIKHCGSTSLGISGQDEIDVYIPVAKNDFNKYINPLIELFGEPRSNYPMERIRFVTDIEEKHIDVFLINKEDEGWINSFKFENYLREHKDCLKEYEDLKRSLNGESLQNYYRKKTEFINNILGRNN
ncbi:MAG: GrpB family protein [Candidatus Pacebacteria bacterium]|nr:GrpB family protein [Candidatus Paceibacterota bacterium]